MCRKECVINIQKLYVDIQFQCTCKLCVVPKLCFFLLDDQQCLKEELLYQSYLSKFIEQEITLSKALKFAHCYQAIT